MNDSRQEAFWSNRYAENRTGWDLGHPSRPLKTYIDQLDRKDLRILIPGAGNAYEAEYLFQEGFGQVSVLDIAQAPLSAFQKRLPAFPPHQLIQGDFFQHQGQYDLILEQTFFCSFEPAAENRTAYARKMAELLPAGGKLVGLWFSHPLFPGAKRPFGGTQEEYLSYLSPYFSVETFDPCYNSIPARAGGEFFGIFKRK